MRFFFLAFARSCLVTSMLSFSHQPKRFFPYIKKSYRRRMKQKHFFFSIVSSPILVSRFGFSASAGGGSASMMNEGSGYGCLSHVNDSEQERKIRTHNHQRDL